MADDAGRMARGTGLTLPGTLLGNGLLLGLDMYVNALLPTADYGLFSVVRRLLAILGVVAQLGMENAVIRAVAAGPADAARGAVRAALRGALIAGGMAAGLLIVLAGPIGGLFDDRPLTRTVLILGALSVPLAGVRLVAVCGSQGRQVVIHRVIVLFLAWPIAQLIGIFALVGIGKTGVEGAMLAYTLSMAVGMGLALGLMHRVAPDWLSPRQPGAGDLGSMMRFSWPLWAQSTLGALYGWADQLLLAGLASTTAAGVYGPVAMIAPLFGLGLGSLNQVFAPIIAEKHAKQDMAGLAGLYRLVTRWALVLTLPPVAVAVVDPVAVIGLWPGGQAEAATALRIVALAWLFCTGVGSVNYLLIMAGHQRATLWNGLLAMALNLLLSFLLVPRFGVDGAGMANAAALVTANGVAMAQVWALLRLHPLHRGLLRPLVAAIPALAVMAGIASLNLSPWPAVLAEGIVGGATLLAALALIGFDAEDASLITKVRQKFGGRR